jgi:hypothetical protein
MAMSPPRDVSTPLWLWVRHVLYYRTRFERAGGFFVHRHARDLYAKRFAQEYVSEAAE